MCHTIGMKAIWICLTAAMVALCGCLQKARTPFNEVSIFGDDSANELEKAPTVENYWPLYLSDGRASYWMWPIIKSSPGCFAVQPAYNYDHGIHDILWFITLSPRSGEYRVWPLFYRCPTWWMFAPFAYAADEIALPLQLEPRMVHHQGPHRRRDPRRPAQGALESRPGAVGSREDLLPARWRLALRPVAGQRPLAQ